MMRSKVLALAVAAALAIGSTTAASGGGVPPPVHHHSGSSANPWPAWLVIGCSALLVWTAVVANARDNRELINGEHWWCGLPYWFKVQPQ
jgi:hypothetical protein